MNPIMNLRPYQVYDGNRYTNKTMSSYWVEAQDPWADMWHEMLSEKKVGQYALFHLSYKCGNKFSYKFTYMCNV